MHAYPYVESLDKVTDVFTAIRTADVPTKFTYRFFEGIGFSSSNDRTFIPALKLLGFLDEKSRPTEYYLKLKDATQFSAILKSRINICYENLLNIDTNAYFASESVLEGYFGSLTGNSSLVSLVYARTFLTLSRLAGIKEGYFNKEERGIRIPDGPEEAVVPASTEISQSSNLPANIKLNINLPSTTDEQVYEALFKHLKELLQP